MCRVDWQDKSLTLVPYKEGFVILHSDKLSKAIKSPRLFSNRFQSWIGYARYGTCGCRSQILELRLSKTLQKPTLADLCSAIELWLAAMLHMQTYALECAVCSVLGWAQAWRRQISFLTRRAISTSAALKLQVLCYNAYKIRWDPLHRSHLILHLYFCFLLKIDHKSTFF